MIQVTGLGELPAGERYFESNSVRCPHRCIVGDKVCICEFVSGHSGECEKVPTRFAATASDYGALKMFPDFLRKRDAYRS